VMNQYSCKTLTHLASVLLLGVLIAFAGCQPSGERLVKVNGDVTYQGEPLVGGVITFQPLENGVVSTRRPSVGVIAKNGLYQMSTLKMADGVRPGEYLVSVDGTLAGESGPPPSLEPVEGPVTTAQGANLHPSKYRSPQTSGLTATVPADVDEIEIDFDLKP
jgi:hypothetical protein